MDMLPMNKTYYTKNIIEYDNTKFIYYRDKICFEYKQIAMCYNVATPETWKDIFKINTVDDIVNYIKNVSNKNIIKEGHGNIGWSIDQTTLYTKVTEWNKKTNNFIRLNEIQTGFKRLDRNRFNISDVNIRKNITDGNYTDYHCYRPMSKFSDINWEIYNLFPKHVEKNYFVSFTTNNNYCELSEIMIKSLNNFSNYKIILYCVDFDKPSYANNYKNLICKRLDWNNKFNIFYLKPLIILDAITNMGVKNGIYIESDDIATKNIDNLFKECERISDYPLCPIHPCDPNNQQNVMDKMNVSKKKTMPYIHGHVVFTDKTKLFIKEWCDTCIKLGNRTCANWDETILNVLFWKHKINDYINYIYDPYYSYIDDPDILNWGCYIDIKKKYNTEVSFNKIYMFHGCKNKEVSMRILEKIQLLSI